MSETNNYFIKCFHFSCKINYSFYTLPYRSTFMYVNYTETRNYKYV